MGPSVGNEQLFECPALPRGWRRKEVVRRSGLASSKVEVCYLSPSGRQITNKLQLVRYLGDAWDLTHFDFQSGRILKSNSAGSMTGGTTNGQSANVSASSGGLSALRSKPITQHHHQNSRGHHGISGSAAALHGVSGGSVQKPVSQQLQSLATAARLDHTMISPIRQTASIFKQPVTLVHTTNRETKPAPTNEIQPSSSLKRDKPKQVFWAKRLQGFRACAMDGETDPLALPLERDRRMTGVGPDVDDTVAELSLAAALQLCASGVAVTGQTGAKKSLDANPGVYVNADQPLIQAAIITEQDVDFQERRVRDARSRLEQALKHFG